MPNLLQLHWMRAARTDKGVSAVGQVRQPAGKGASSWGCMRAWRRNAAARRAVPSCAGLLRLLVAAPGVPSVACRPDQPQVVSLKMVLEPPGMLERINAALPDQVRMCQVKSLCW